MTPRCTAERASVGLALLCLLVTSCTSSPSAAPEPPERVAPSASGEFTFDKPLAGTRDERTVELVDSPHGLLAWTTGGLKERSGAEWRQASFLRSSNDGGRTWTEHSGGPWNVHDMRVGRPQIIGSTVLVTADEHDPRGSAVGQITPSLWQSDDLENWEEVSLPDAPDDGWVQVSAVDEQTYLVMTLDRNTAERGWFLSTDRGATFVEVSPPHPDHPARMLGMVAGRFVVILEPTGHEQEDYNGARVGPVLATSSDGLEWNVEDRNTGLWGDAQPRLEPPVLDGDPLYAPFARRLRSDIRYCIADVSSCQQYEQGIAVIDGENDTRELLIDLSTVEPQSGLRFVRSPDSLLVWVPTHDPPNSRFSAQGYRWDDLGPDQFHRPAPLAPPPEPSSPVLELYRDVAPIGERFHTRLAIGGACGADRFSQDGRWYVLSGTEWPTRDEIPASWPFQTFDGHDGPMGYLFVEAERIDVDTFHFFVDEDTTVEYRYDPGGEPEFRC